MGRQKTGRGKNKTRCIEMPLWRCLSEQLSVGGLSPSCRQPGVVVMILGVWLGVPAHLPVSVGQGQVR